MVSGKEFRSTLTKPLPGTKKSDKVCRVVPAFTIQAFQKEAAWNWIYYKSFMLVLICYLLGTCVIPPPKCNAFKEVVPRGAKKFRMNYQRGNLPISLEAKGGKVSWKADVNKLDFHYYLPMFFEGLCETENPYKLFAQQGIYDMLAHGGPKIFPCIPQLIIPIKDALKTKNKEVMCTTLRVLQHLVKSGDMVGEALVPYYRQILPSLNLFKERNVNCGDEIDYSQMRGDNLADIINDTLELLEKYGGEDAFINIKYLIPTYESCMMN